MSVLLQLLIYTVLIVVAALYKRNNDYYYLPLEERKINFKNDIKKEPDSFAVLTCCSLHQVKLVTTGTVLVV